MPRLKPGMIAMDGGDAMACAQALRAVVEKTKDAKSEASSLRNKLTELKNSDNILPKLMSQTDNYDELFKQEITKYSDLCEEVDKYVTSSVQLKSELEAATSAFTQTYKVEEWKQACQAVVNVAN